MSFGASIHSNVSTLSIITETRRRIVMSKSMSAKWNSPHRADLMKWWTGSCANASHVNKPVAEAAPR